MPAGQTPDSFYLWRELLVEGEPFVNGVCYGFKDDYVFCTDENQHIEALFTHYAEGTTAYFAVERANADVQIPSINGSRGATAPLHIAGGDGAYATFSHVYLPPDVRSALPGPYFVFADWKYIDPQVP